MKRKLLKQICTEWRTNVWLAIELLIVSVVLWYVMDFMYQTYRLRSLPRGFDTEHCYLLSFNKVTDKSPDYIPDRSWEGELEDKAEILSRLQHLPFVEAASLSANSFPYNGSNSGIQAWSDTIRTTGGYVVRRPVTPDFVRVFKYRGTRGETPEQLAEMLEKDNILINEGGFEGLGITTESMIGKRFKHDSSDTTMTFPLGAALIPPRYSDYTVFSHTVVFKLPTDWYDWSNEWCIRVRPEEDYDIPQRLMDQAGSLFHVGNNLLVNVTPFSVVRDRFQQDNTNQERNMYVMMGFLLLNIFLGLFGTFWFRTQQRAHEVAVRKALGATPGQIFARLITEGLILLAIVTPIAFGIDCLLDYLEFSHDEYRSGMEIGRVAICACISASLMALMIILGIWFPAARAQRIDPALTLKDE